MKKIKKVMIIAIFIFLVCATFAACSKHNKEQNKYTVYDVTFMLSDGEFFIEQSSAETGKVVKPANPERVNFTFVDWFYDLEYDKSFDFESVIDSDITLYACWEKAKSKIRFEGNGSTAGTMNDLETEFDSILKLPYNAFTREGYSFVGWADTANGNVKNKDGGWFYMENQGTVTLFACWQPNKYYVNLDHQGGNSNISQVTATYDDNLPSFAIPTKVGFIFDGYFTQTDGKGVKYYDSIMNSCRKYCLSTDTTLYAHWVEARNKIAFDGNGSTGGGTAYIDASTFENVILPECGFLRAGYTFREWNTQADGLGNSYSAGKTFVMPVNDDTIILYACWDANNYKVYFDDGMGGERISESHIYDVEKALRPNTFTKYGYQFVAWSDAQGGQGNYYSDAQNVVNLCSELDGEVILYAVWTPKSVKIDFNKVGGTGGTNYVNVTFGANFPSAVSPSKIGYSFGGYFSEEGGQGKMYLDHNMRPVNLSDKGDDSEVFAYWIPRTNTVIFEPNGGNGQSIELATVTDAEIQLSNYSFSRVGYSLSGWSTMADGSGEYFDSKSGFSVPAQSSFIRLYAIWSANAIVLTFVGNGNDGGAMSAMETYCGQQIILPNCSFVKIGYKFIGWGTTSDGTQIYNLDSLYSIPKTDNTDIKLFARWELEKYLITYDLDGGNNSSYNPSYYTYLSGEIKLQNPTKRGYEFLYWGGDEPIAAGSTGNKNYIAIWDRIEYSIKYNLNGGHFTDDEEVQFTYNVDSKIIYLPNPLKDGSVFEGWNEGNCIEPGSIGNKTFTAQWQGINYTITYILNGGENGEGNPATYMKDTATFKLSEPNRKGYKFKGWTSEELGIGTANKSVTIYQGSEGNITLTAEWEIVTYKITYILNGGENSVENPDQYFMSENDIMLYDPTRSGYIFDGWLEGNIIESNSSGDLTFTAMWTAITYELYVFVNEDISPDPIIFTIESDDITISIDNDISATYSVTTGNGTTVLDAVHIGYRLVGWYEGDDDSVAVSTFTIPKGTMGTKFIMAKWEIIEYSINYVIDDDVILGDDSPNIYTIDDYVILLEPTREGYQFVGWENQDGEIVSEIPIGSIGDVTLTAKWQVTTQPDPDPIDPERMDN